MTDTGAREMLLAELRSSQELAVAMLDDQEMMDEAILVAGLVVDTYRSGNKVMFFGNGGSAADSIHIAAEFVGRFLTDRRPLPALSLAANLSSVTAISNDYGFEAVFARQLEALGSKGDLAVGLTTSGQSVNLIRAFEYAAGAGIRSVAMTGTDPRAAGAAADHVIAVPSAATPHIQQGHMMLAHFICGWVEHELLAEKFSSPARLSAGRTAFLDRDGTINESPPEGDYLEDPAEVRLIAGAAEAIRRLNELDICTVVVTNQRGIALGLMTEEDLAAVNARVEELLAAEGAHVDGIYHCPHAAGSCDCRKPGPGMFRRAEREMGDVQIEGAAMVGDSRLDIEAGLNLGLMTVRIGTTMPGEPTADHNATSLPEAVAWLIAPAAGDD